MTAPEEDQTVSTPEPEIEPETETPDIEDEVVIEVEPDLDADVEIEGLDAVAPIPAVFSDRPIQTVGRRKEAIVRVRLVPGSGQFTLNGRSLEQYFPNKLHQHLAAGPGIAAVVRDRAVRAVALGQDVRGRGGERHRELRGEHLAVGEAAHAVGTEQTPRAHGQRLLY